VNYKDGREITSQEKRWIGIILAVALIHGLIYIFFIPPWQHYDEPNHFEYVWLTAHLNRFPQPGDYDPDFSRIVVQSMIDFDFFKGMDWQPDLSSTQEIRIHGLSQLYEPPFYYFLAALPLRLFNISDVVNQLYASRIVSLFFYLITILAEFGVTTEITPTGHPLRWMTPLALALLPGFTDLMTAVNNDSSAVAALSLFLWGSSRLIMRPFAWTNLFWVIISSILCFVTKSTAMVGLVCLPAVLLFSIIRGRARRYVWWIILIGFLAGVILIIDWGDAAFWYKSTSQREPTRVNNKQAIAGSHVISLDTSALITPDWVEPLFQPLPVDVARALHGKTVTFGVWMWADKPGEGRSPAIETETQSVSIPVTLGTEPVFYSFQVELSNDIYRTWISLKPGIRDLGGISVFYDGFILAEGAHPMDIPPTFNSADGETGDWGGMPFENLIRNPSAEQAGFRVRPIIDHYGSKILGDETRPSLVITSILDLQASRDLYRISIIRIFRTFWGMFGWGHVPLIGYQPYRNIGILTLLLIVTAILGLWRKRLDIPWDVIFILSVIMVLSFSVTVVRGALYLGLSHIYYPVARHAYPAIIPTVLTLCFGWLELCHLIAQAIEKFFTGLIAELQRKLPSKLISLLGDLHYVLFFVFLIGLDLLSLYSISKYYGSA